jgi:hypothetical protein
MMAFLLPAFLLVFAKEIVTEMLIANPDLFVNLALGMSQSLDVWVRQFQERTTVGILTQLLNLRLSQHLLLRILLPIYLLLSLLLSLQMFLPRIQLRLPQPIQHLSQHSQRMTMISSIALQNQDQTKQSRSPLLQGSNSLLVRQPLLSVVFSLS